MGPEFSIITRTIGPGGDDRHPLLACLTLRGKSIQAPDIVHAWSLGTLWAAVFGGARRILFSPAQFPNRRSIRWLATAMKRRQIDVVCSSQAQQRVYARYGIGPERCTVVRPGVDVPPRSGRNREIRSELGLSDNDYVLLAPGESTRPAAHGDAFWATGIVHVLDPSFRILLWGRGPGASACARFAAKVDQPATVVVATQKLGRKVEFDELLSAADAVLFAPSGPTPMLPIALCMAAGVPIVATPTPWFGDLLKDGQNSAVVPKRSSRMLAQRVIELRQDAALRTRICESARDEARGLFSVGNFVEQYRSIYRNV